MSPEDRMVLIGHLIDELKKLMRGAKPFRLVPLAILRAFAQVDESATIKIIGQQMFRFLITAIDSLPDSEFHGTVYPASRLNRTLKIAFGIERSNESLHARRIAMMMLLQLPYSVSYWRSSDHEFESTLLRILTEHIVTSAEPQTLALAAAA